MAHSDAGNGHEGDMSVGLVDTVMLENTMIVDEMKILVEDISARTRKGQVIE